MLCCVPVQWLRPSGNQQMANRFLVALGTGEVELFQANSHVSALNNDRHRYVYTG